MIGKSLGGDGVKDLTENCRDCIYYGKNLDNCDYFEIMNAMRPCPPADECTVKVSKSRTPDMFDPKTVPKRGGSQRKGVTSWDTELAYRLWMEGLPTGHIAEMVGISGSTLSGYATKHGWPRDHRPKQGQWKKEWRTNVKEETAGTGSTGAGETAEAALSGAAGGVEEAQAQCDHLGSDGGGRALPECPAPDHRRSEGGQEMSEQELLEAAIGKKTGVEAYLTGVAVRALCNWQFSDDLRDARDAIDKLLERLEK